MQVESLKAMTDRETILTLGDGDFTFSESLRRGLVGAASIGECQYDLIATCFDDRNTVLEKYSGSARNAIQALESSTTARVTVMYGVDATRPLDIVLQNGLRTVDHIIFMFPHLGIEDCRLHAALLAHIMHRAAEILSRQGGRLYIALADDQPANWKLFETASRLGFVALDEISFRRDQFLGYETRRHQSGKSFSSRVSSIRVCFVFGFDHNGCTMNIISRALQGHEESIQHISKKQKKKRRRMQELTQEHIESLSDKGYVCKLCGNRYDLLRGVQSHIYQQHVLADENTEDNPTHERIKEEKSSNTRKLSKTIRIHDRGEGKYVCNICELSFTTQDDLNSHEREGISPSTNVSAQRCRQCNRTFRDIRALDQHTRHCSSSIASLASSPLVYDTNLK
jgi:rubrerythrin